MTVRFNKPKKKKRSSPVEVEVLLSKDIGSMSEVLPDLVLKRKTRVASTAEVNKVITSVRVSKAKEMAAQAPPVNSDRQPRESSKIEYYRAKLVLPVETKPGSETKLAEQASEKNGHVLNIRVGAKVVVMKTQAFPQGFCAPVKWFHKVTN